MAITPSQWSHKLTIPESYTPPAATSGQTLVINESVIAKLSAGDQTTFWSNVQNGGGDVRICTDSAGTNQLPVDMVSLDNVAETCVIWTRKATYAGTGDLYVFIGKVGETKAPDTDPFGRNAVWVDYEAVLHLNDSSYTDVTGNGRDGLANGSISQGGTDHPFSGNWTDFGANSTTNSLTLQSTGGVLDQSYITVSAWIKRTNAQNSQGGIVSNRKQGGSTEFFQLNQRVDSDLDWQVVVRDGGGESDFVSYNDPTPLETKRLTLTSDASNVLMYTDGNLTITCPTNEDGLFSNNDDIVVGNYFNGGLGFKGWIGEVWIKKGTDSANKNATEYANQNDPASFYGTPTIATTGGATGVTADAAYTINAPTFSASADASLPQPIANAAFTLNAPTFSANASATTPGFSASVAYSANAPTFAADAAVTLPQPTADVTYTVAAPTFSVDSTATLPQPTANATFSLPAPTFAASATVTQTGFNASVNFTLPAPTFSASATATLPQPIADGNFTITAPTFSVVAIAGGIAIIVDNETNINMPALSTNINAPVLSNNVRI